MIVPPNSQEFFQKFFSRSPSSRAFLAIGEEESREALLQSLMEHLPKNIKPSSSDILTRHPMLGALDLYTYKGEALAIDSAREIHERAHQTSWTGSKIFLIACDSISFEVQAVLLKTLEEPTPNTYFIISAKSETGLSAPLLSRLAVLKAKSKGKEKSGMQAPWLKSLKKELEEVGHAAKERGTSEKFLDTLEIWAQNEVEGERQDYHALARFLEDLLQTKEKFFEKTYSHRMLLEHIIISRAYLNPTP